MAMHTIEPARLKPGSALDRPGTTGEAGVKDDGAPRVLRGQALIVWDAKTPGRKLDAIDTDQITPAADCVSESLETLDERWKAGSFRYLMPDFRQRVHRGETFLIAGDRFAIGSSREMSPAGLKGVAEEAGLAYKDIDVVARALLHAPGDPLISTIPRHSHGWLLTNPFAERYSPDSMPAVAANSPIPHCACCRAAASSTGASAGSSSASAGTRPGLSTSSRLLHPTATVNNATSPVRAMPRRTANRASRPFMYEVIVRLPSVRK